MVTFIRLYPLFAACFAFISFEFARNFRRKGNHWIFPAIISLLLIASIALWVVYRGDKNAEQWAKDWASLTFFHYTYFV